MSGAERIDYSGEQEKHVLDIGVPEPLGLSDDDPGLVRASVIFEAETVDEVPA